MRAQARWALVAAAVGATAAGVAAADADTDRRTRRAEPAVAGSSPPRTTVRDCRSRGEATGRDPGPPRDFLAMGSTRSALNSFMDSDPSEFAAVAEWDGFRQWLRGPRGQALSPAERERVVRRAAVHYTQKKTPIAVRAGHTVTLSVARGDRTRAAFIFAWRRGHRIGPYWAYRVADGTPRVRFIACPADEPKFSGPGRVGPWTWYPGAMLVAGARCLTLVARERGRPTFRYHLGFGRDDCRPPGES